MQPAGKLFERRGQGYRIVPPDPDFFKVVGKLPEGSPAACPYLLQGCSAADPLSAADCVFKQRNARSLLMLKRNNIAADYVSGAELSEDLLFPGQRFLTFT